MIIMGNVFLYFEFLNIVFVKDYDLVAVSCDSAEVLSILWGTIERCFEHMKDLELFSSPGI